MKFLGILFLKILSLNFQENELDGSDLESSHDEEEWNSDSSR